MIYPADCSMVDVLCNTHIYSLFPQNLAGPHDLRTYQQSNPRRLLSSPIFSQQDPQDYISNIFKLRISHFHETLASSAFQHQRRLFRHRWSTRVYYQKIVACQNDLSKIEQKYKISIISITVMWSLCRHFECTEPSTCICVFKKKQEFTSACLHNFIVSIQKIQSV